jgi:hypothetical protein
MHLWFILDFFGPQMALAYRLDAISWPKKLSNSRANPLPPALVIDMHASKHYAGCCINHWCKYRWFYEHENPLIGLRGAVGGRWRRGGGDLVGWGEIGWGGGGDDRQLCWQCCPGSCCVHISFTTCLQPMCECECVSVYVSPLGATYTYPAGGSNP